MKYYKLLCWPATFILNIVENLLAFLTFFKCILHKYNYLNFFINVIRLHHILNIKKKKLYIPRFHTSISYILKLYLTFKKVILL